MDDLERPVKLESKRLPWIVSTVALTLMLTSTSFGYARFKLGSMSNILPFLKGNRLCVDSYTKLIEPQKEDAEIKVTFNLSSLTSKPIKIVGANSSCSCSVTNSLPAIIPPQGQYAFNMEVHTKKEEDLDQTVELYTDLIGQAPIKLRILEPLTVSIEKRKS